MGVLAVFKIVKLRAIGLLMKMIDFYIILLVMIEYYLNILLIAHQNILVVKKQILIN